MRRIGDVEIDARQVRHAAAVLVSLDQEVTPVVVACGRTAGVVIQFKVRVLVWLRARAVAQKPKIRDVPFA